jgi:hypothetical protein
MSESNDKSNFEVPVTSSTDAPGFTLHFRGHTVHAELAGAKLYGEAEGDDRTRLRLTDASGEVLADITVHPRAHRNATENVIDVGSALLWSHWRWTQAQAAQPQAFALGTDTHITTVGGIWTGADGTRYRLLAPADVGDRPRWWIGRDLVKDYEHVAANGFGAGTTEDPRWQIGPETPADLHHEPLCTECDEIVFALVLSEEPTQ